MIEILIALYAGICWLIFIKFKLLPWTFVTKVIVYSLPIFGAITLILCLNYYTPITSDIRVLNRSVDINPQILGRVTKVYVKSNQEVKKGDTLFTLDPDTYIFEIKALEAKLKSSESSLTADTDKIESARGTVITIQSQLKLANKRVLQYQELVNSGAANKFDLEQAQSTVAETEGKLKSAKAELQVLESKVSGVYNGQNSNLAEINAKIEQAKWNLKQTVVLAPTDGLIPNVQINPGTILSAFKSAFVLIQKEQSVVGLFAQNELQAVKPGDEVEISLRTEPGKVIKAKLEYYVDATSQGILNNAGGMFGGNGAGLPDTSKPYPDYEGKLAAKFIIENGTKDFTVGARGNAVIYSEHMKIFHIVRKIMVRVNSKMNYIIPKLH